jgi:hypothetical protein
MHTPAQSVRPTAEAIRHEMAHRAPPAREIAGDQRIICLLPNQEQWMSLGELRRSLRGGAVVPFPKDNELAQSMISCGAVGASDYRAAWVFAALSHFLNSQGVVTQNFCKRQLRLSCCTLSAARELVEQFIAQVVVVREEVLIILQPGAEATSFPIWNDRIRVFVANQARMLPAGNDVDMGAGGSGGGFGGEEGAAIRYGGAGVGTSGGASGAGPGVLAAAPAGAAADPHAPGARAVRQRVDAGPGWTGAAADAAGMPPWGAGGAGAGAQQPPPQQHGGGFSGSARSGGGGGGGSGRLLSSGGTHMRTPSIMGGEGGQGLDWSWPPIEPDDRAMAEIAFDRQMGVPRGGWCVRFVFALALCVACCGGALSVLLCTARVAHMCWLLSFAQPVDGALPGLSGGCGRRAKECAPFCYALRRGCMRCRTASHMTHSHSSSAPPRFRFAPSQWRLRRCGTW